MLKNYFKIFFRTTTDHKVFSFINITGMAIGITCFILISLFVLDESGFDDFNVNKDQICRVLVHFRFNGVDQVNAKSCPPLGPVLKNTYPEVLNYARIGYPGQHYLSFNDKSFREGDIYTADSTYFDLFTLPFLYGDKNTALREPNTMIISESAAKKYFGDVNSVGKFLLIDNSLPCKVTGVMKDFPRKAHFSCNFLVSMPTFKDNSENDWLDGGYTTYLLLQKGTDIKSFNNKLKAVVSKYIGPMVGKMIGITLNDFERAGNLYSYEIEPLTSIYLKSQSDYGVDTNTEWGHERVSNISYSYIFAAVGMFILLIAIFNFMNLSTAISEKRSKEVGIRKTLGSDRLQLIGQFLSESLFTSIISVAVSVGLTYLVLPYFNGFIGRNLTLNLFDNFYAIPLLLALAFVIGIVAGSYPAFYLSSFQSVQIFKGGTGAKSRKSKMRSILVVLQFAISITLFIGTFIIKNQLSYIQNKNLGFNKDALIAINNGSVISRNLKIFKEELSSNPDVLSSTASSLMFAPGIPGNGFLFDQRRGNDIIPAQTLDVDYDFAKTYQISVKYGRYFSEDYGADSNAVVVNEVMAHRFNVDNPTGRSLYAMNNDTREMIQYKIIGVIKDFNFESLHQAVRPLVLHLSPVRQASTIITIRIAPQNIQNTIAQIDKLWTKYAGEDKISRSYINENLARMYIAEQKIQDVAAVFSVLAIIIACLGLFGMVLFVTEQRTKEIGIRKALGATVFEIILLLSKEFTKWILVANIIAWPAAYYFMSKWLESFAYKAEIEWSIFLISGVLVFIIAVATLSIQVARAALMNPVASLRYE